MKATNFDVIPDLYEDVRQALRLWHEPTPENPLAHLHLFQDAYTADNLRKFVNTLLLEALEALAIFHPEDARLLRMRFLDGMTAETTAYRLGMSVPNTNKQQKKAIHALASLLWQREQALRTSQQTQFLAHLEAPTYDQLFGAETALHHLSPILKPATEPWLIVLEGIGGIGKTALADAIMRQAITQQRYGGFGWVSARQQRLQPGGMLQVLSQPVLRTDHLLEQLCLQLLRPAALPQPFTLKSALPILTAHLKTTPHLIAIDNLETLDDLHELLPILQRLAKPTKFLLTSRASIQAETATYAFAIEPLSKSDALALVRHEAHLRNLPELLGATAAELAPIYATAGGNPLALRLLVGQTRLHALQTVLADLKEARGQAVENLYTYIYRYAWDNLTDPARRVLLAMPFAPETGATAQHLTDICKLEPAMVHDALGQLVALNLTNHHGTLTASRYTIHSLTRTFLLKQVAQWM